MTIRPHLMSDTEVLHVHSIEITKMLRWVRGHPRCLLDFGEPRSVYADLCKQSDEPLFVGRRIVLLTGWVVVLNVGVFRSSYTLVPTSRLLWSHIKRTKNWFILVIIPIPTGSDFSIVIHYHSGDGRVHSLEAGTDEAGSQWVMQILTGIAPWHIMGYSEDIAREWGRDKTPFFRSKEVALQEYKDDILGIGE